MERASDIRNYIVVTAAYWAFTLTDGALRMLVLLHFHALGYTPFELALLFVLYEIAGVVTNLVGGWLGSRLGLTFTLLTGLALQVGALLMLSGLSPTWTVAMQVAYVITAQGISGVAKDFTKLSAKSAIKLLVPEDAPGMLFRWVAILTGSKNTLKGIGFFLGGLLLAGLGFRGALWAMAGGISLAMLSTALLLPREMGRARAKVPLRSVLSKSRSVNILSAARMFLFCARDVWFVVGLPVFLSDVMGWSFVGVGTYMAAWVIGYGIVQASTPRLLRRMGTAHTNDARAAQVWGVILALVPFGIYGIIRAGGPVETTAVIGLGVFGVVFAVNSAVHSYLILAYSDADKVTLDVGFYYMANAVGRLMGTLASGLLYQHTGLAGCLLAAGGLVVMSSLLAMALPNPRAPGPIGAPAG